MTKTSRSQGSGRVGHWEYATSCQDTAARLLQSQLFINCCTDEIQDKFRQIWPLNKIQPITANSDLGEAFANNISSTVKKRDIMLHHSGSYTIRFNFNRQPVILPSSNQQFWSVNWARPQLMISDSPRQQRQGRSNVNGIAIAVDSLSESVFPSNNTPIVYDALPLLDRLFLVLLTSENDQSQDVAQPTGKENRHISAQTKFPCNRRRYGTLTF